MCNILICCKWLHSLFVCTENLPFCLKRTSGYEIILQIKYAYIGSIFFWTFILEKRCVKKLLRWYKSCVDIFRMDSKEYILRSHVSSYFYLVMKLSHYSLFYQLSNVSFMRATFSLFFHNRMCLNRTVFTQKAVVWYIWSQHALIQTRLCFQRLWQALQYHLCKNWLLFGTSPLLFTYYRLSAVW